MTDPEHAARMTTADTDWPTSPSMAGEPDDDSLDALGWREVRGAMVIIGALAVALVVAGVVVW